uniref:Uncharacterized protein n=1 Tax=Erpetoichthys calabaricus TaxID=27687 RepID=A0A8C4S240_ERPCA
MFLDCGRKPEHPEETHADTGRTCKLHAGRTREVNSGLLTARQQYICAEIMATASEIRQHILGPLNPSFSLFRALEISLRRNLPESAHQLASGRLFISVTRLDNRENRLCNNTVYCWYIDGGLTNMLPVEAKEETITVSPFSGEIDICPQDDPETVNIMQMCGFNFYLNMRNFIRMSDALFPPPSQVILERSLSS